MKISVTNKELETILEALEILLFEIKESLKEEQKEKDPALDDIEEWEKQAAFVENLMEKFNP